MYCSIIKDFIFPTLWLLVETLPIFESVTIQYLTWKHFFQVRFVIGGDGPKRVRLEEMREKHSLQDRVEMLGAVPHARVQSVLIRGHVFLNRYFQC